MSAPSIVGGLLARFFTIGSAVCQRSYRGTFQVLPDLNPEPPREELLNIAPQLDPLVLSRRCPGAFPTGATVVG